MSQIMMIAPNAEKVDKPTDKAVGANKDTNWVLMRIAKNHLHYIQLAEKWESGKADVRKAKKRFEEILEEEKGTPDPYVNEAWRFYGGVCNSRKAAAELYTKDLEKERSDVPKKLGLSGMNHLERSTTVKAATAVLDEKIAGLKRGIAAITKRAAESKIQEEFPGSGGFIRQQQVSQKLREWQRKAGGPMDKEERRKKFPELEPGWPDIQGDDAPLPFEQSIKASEKARAQEQLETTNKILNAALKAKLKAEAEQAKAVSKSKPAPKPVDRRHNAEPDAAAVRYVVQPGRKRPAAAAAAQNNMPRNEGEASQKGTNILGDIEEEEEDDGAGALPPHARKQQKRATSPSLLTAERAQPFVAPEGQGKAYDIIFRDDEEEEEESAPSSSSDNHPEEASDHEFSDDSDDDE